MPLISIEGSILNDIAIECIYRDGNDKLWLFSRRGIYIMDVKKKRIENHLYIKDKPYPVNNLVCYLFSSSGDVWVGTMGGGINILATDGSYNNINLQDNFLPETIFGLLEDPLTKNIWMSTSDGIYYYDKEKDSYHKADVFDSNIYGSFYPRSCFSTRNGEMLFGGTLGFILFNPNNIHKNEFKPRVFFTELVINNTQEQPGENAVLKSHISALNIPEDNPVTLSYKQTHIRIHFSSNNYLNSSKNKFAYKLNGSAGEWIILPEDQRFVQFANLTSGSYVFEVKTANNDGIWGDAITTLHFKIKPAPWFSIWAWIFYFSLFMSFFVIIWRLYANRKLYFQRLKLEKMRKQKMNELIQLRVDFFTNISHDLKTPLTLIMNPLESLKKVLPEDAASIKYVQMIEKNVTKIQRMISQLLQFREIESKKVTLNPQQGDIIKYVFDIFELFIPYAGKKFLSTHTSSYRESLIVEFDYDTIEKIMFNLISNAIKYSPEGETVCIKISEADHQNSPLHQNHSNSQYIAIEVINTGIEIDKDKQKKLFKSFSRLTDKIPVFESSTGLGLSIVKELVKLTGGTISMESKNKTVTFRIILPFTRIKEEVKETNQFSYHYTLTELSITDIISEEEVENPKERRKSYDVVLVEDSIELSKYLEKEMSTHFNMYTAANGEEGIIVVRRVNPQVVVTDLKMPKLDGFELSKILKSDIKTSHIPIIVISALGNEPKNKVKSLKDGADLFIEKPFDINYLIEQIKNLIKTRESLKEHYSKKFIAEPTRITFSSLDEKFLEQAISYIEKNIDNPEYTVESFVADMGGSRTLLYRKINEITGMSIKEFILDMRLKRSAQLLEDSQLTIGEVAYAVGFNDARYFSICFKKHYGISPSEFKKKEESQNISE